MRDAMERGPLGFPVVDVEVVLTDGSYHSVDSSELAFRTAGRIAMTDALKACDAYLLEPIDKVTIHAPSSATSRITSAISSRRGQILGYDTRGGWPGWDQIEVYFPEADRHDLIVELRSATQGLGAYEAAFSHMAEVPAASPTRSPRRRAPPPKAQWNRRKWPSNIFKSCLRFAAEVGEPDSVCRIG